jgi:hypothetical protein
LTHQLIGQDFIRQQCGASGQCSDFSGATSNMYSVHQQNECNESNYQVKYQTCQIGDFDRFYASEERN